MPIGSNGPRRGRSDSRSAECPIGRRGSHARKHGITFEEAATVFADPLALIIEDESRPENARIIGESLAARILLVVFIEQDRDFVKLISARRATRHKRRRTGQRMDSSKDVLFLVLTSHGSEGQLSVSNRTWPLEQLDAVTLRKALDDSGIKWRVIVISACHSGAFIPALADESTAIFASAAADRASFGCGDDREITEFGAAFVRDALPRATSLEAAFEQAKAVLAEGERRQKVQPSSPQARVGAAISAHWQRIEAQRDLGLQGGKHADRPNTPGRTRAARTAG